MTAPSAVRPDDSLAGVNDDAVSWVRQPGSGKYAKLERERRFLLTEMPAQAKDPRLIEDRYITGTRLRLRRVEADSQVVYKFCQKVRPHDGDPSTVAITNIYLAEAEYERLCQLPAAILRKTRRIWQIGHHTFAVDKFHGDLAGLLVAEIELPDLTQELPLPAPFGKDVTSDDRFSGGHLAHATPAGKAQLLTLARGESR
jgi:CYTH domain-containing protein